MGLLKLDISGNSNTSQCIHPKLGLLFKRTQGDFKGIGGEMMNKQRQGHQLTHSLTFNSNFSLLLTFYEGVSQSDQKFKIKVVWEINWAYLGKP